MRMFLSMCMTAAVLFFSACQTTPYVVKESDKLTEQEKYHLFDYSRHFILRTIITKPKEQAEAKKKELKNKKRGPESREVKQIGLSESEKDQLRRLILSNDPKVRVHYTGFKEGKLSLSWLLPGKMQINVSAHGKLDLSGAKEANWRLNIIRYERDCFMLPEELGIPAVD